MVVLKERELKYPFRASVVRRLRAGDLVSLSGKAFTGRDRVHKYLSDGGECPVDIREGCIFHCGPLAVQDGSEWIIKSAGPTTSARQDPYMPGLIEKYHIRVIVGKGGMGEATRKACMKCGCVYLQAIGGAGALLGQRIKSVESVHFLKEFGAADALWEFETENFPAVVAIDTHGRSVYERIASSSKSAMKELFERRVRLG